MKITWCHRCTAKNRALESIPGEYYQVVCQECGLRGLPATSTGKAIRNWNRGKFVQEEEPREEEAEE